MSWTASLATTDFTSRVDVSNWLISFTGVVRHLDGGEWEARLPSQAWSRIVERWPAQDAAPLLFVVQWTDARQGTLIAGPIRTATLERTGGELTVRLTGVDDWAAVFNARDVWPEPANEPPWTTDAYHVVTGQASAAVAALVTSHAGPGARGERQFPITVVDEGAGETGTWRYRLSPLGTAVADIANAAGLFVDVNRDAASVTVTVGAVKDRTSHVINEAKLEDFALTLSTGGATTVVAGGGGDGTSRLFSLVGSGVSGWARREEFSDQRSIDTQPSLNAAAAAIRAAGSSSTSMSGRLLDPSALRWRQHYNLGDVLTLSAAGTNWLAPVTAVSVEIDGTLGLRVSPVLGAASRYALTQLLRDVSNLSARVSSLEVS